MLIQCQHLFPFSFIAVRKISEKQYITVDNSHILLYAVNTKLLFRKEPVLLRVFRGVPAQLPIAWKGLPMNIVINHSSMIPIYEQITAQIKASVMDGILKADDALPSVRSLSKELKISADGEKSVRPPGRRGIRRHHPWKREFHRRRKSGNSCWKNAAKTWEADLETAIQKGRQYGLTDPEIRALFELIIED